MGAVFSQLEPVFLALAFGVALCAGFVKGAVGFAMPMIMISGLGSFLAPELALAALILPTLVTNVWQALRDGLAAAWASILRFRVYIALVLVFIAGSAQLVRVLPSWALFLVIGGPATAFAVAQLLGWRLHLRPEHRRRAEVVIGAIAGFVGGLSGVWGPPTVAYLTAIEVPKAEHIRVQGAVYGLGAMVLTAAHVNSGLFNAQSAPLSVVLLVPAVVGLLIGFWVQDRLDQERFRRATLWVLVFAGLNLIRRGLAG
ncbi:MAG: sulfite exporter TauE/SafE family protein [Rhodobacter sp.]|nr:sulfite exporter TauE/SafE family protein [Rhodobacter sp.]